MQLVDKLKSLLVSNHNEGDAMLEDRSTVDEDTQQFDLFADEREERTVDPEKVVDPQRESETVPVPEPEPEPEPEPGPVTTPDEGDDDDGEDDTA